MNKKGSELILRNTVEAIIFILLFIVVIVILSTWWNAYTSQGSRPAIKSLNNLKKSIEKLDPEYIDITRTVSIQTKEYIILGFSNNPDLCGVAEDSALNCLCVCNNEDCETGIKEPLKYCKVIPYNPDGIKVEVEEVRNYEVKLDEGNNIILLG